MTYSSAWLCHKAITLCLHKSLVNLLPGSLEEQHHQLKETYSIELTRKYPYKYSPRTDSRPRLLEAESSTPY